jgi:membrane-associated HD superfamily phosphohydrolase
MNINGLETQFQNYPASGTSSTKSNSETVDSFQKVIVNLQKRLKETIDKERENDSNGNIRMSENQWLNLMKKVDTALDNLKDNKIEQEEEEKKLLEEKILNRKEDAVAVSCQKCASGMEFPKR